MSSETFKWEPYMSVEIEELDHQHQELIAIINSLYDAIERGTAQEKLNQILDRLEDYQNTHFTTEENYFQQFHFEGADEHIAEHRQFVNKMREYRGKLNAGVPQLAFELTTYLQDWWSSHMVGMDKGYIECFHKNGLK